MRLFVWLAFSKICFCSEGELILILGQMDLDILVSLEEFLFVVCSGVSIFLFRLTFAICFIRCRFVLCCAFSCLIYVGVILASILSSKETTLQFLNFEFLLAITLISHMITPASHIAIVITRETHRAIDSKHALQKVCISTRPLSIF